MTVCVSLLIVMVTLIRYKKICIVYTFVIYVYCSADGKNNPFLNWSAVTLFTRPRRFGKTLAQSMLRTFFEEEVAADGCHT